MVSFSRLYCSVRIKIFIISDDSPYGLQHIWYFFYGRKLETSSSIY